MYENGLLFFFATDVRAHYYIITFLLLIVTAQADSHATSSIERALSSKINYDREDGHCYSFAWI